MLWFVYVLPGGFRRLKVCGYFVIENIDVLYFTHVGLLLNKKRRLSLQEVTFPKHRLLRHVWNLRNFKNTVKQIKDIHYHTWTQSFACSDKHIRLDNRFDTQKYSTKMLPKYLHVNFKYWHVLSIAFSAFYKSDRTHSNSKLSKPCSVIVFLIFDQIGDTNCKNIQCEKWIHLSMHNMHIMLYATHPRRMSNSPQAHVKLTPGACQTHPRRMSNSPQAHVKLTPGISDGLDLEYVKLSRKSVESIV